MKELYRKAAKIIAAERAAQQAEAKQAAEEQRVKDQKLTEEFELAFADYLPMIKEAGITYKAYHEGPYISFSHSDYAGTSATFRFTGANMYKFNDGDSLGEWYKDGIILLLAKAFPIKTGNACGNYEVSGTAGYCKNCGLVKSTHGEGNKIH